MALKFVAAIILSAAIAATPALAGGRVTHVSIVAPVDGVASMGPYSTLRSDCTVSSFARVTLLSTPRKGAIMISQDRGDPNFSKSTSFSGCNNGNVEGPMVQYQPYGHARGVDRFRFQALFEDGERRIIDVRMLIR